MLFLHNGEIMSFLCAQFMSSDAQLQENVAITFTSIYDKTGPRWDKHIRQVWSDLLEEGTQVAAPLKLMKENQEHAPTFILKMLLMEFDRGEKGFHELSNLRKNLKKHGTRTEIFRLMGNKNSKVQKVRLFS